ncbi:MAG: type II secretion system minor pseudopilin GspJ [Pseudomonadota bacterium]
MGRARQGGYTLIEVLVAVLVFGVLTASAYTALDSLSLAAMTHREHAEQLASLQTSVARLDADLRQLSHRATRTPLGQSTPAFSGSAFELQGIRAGWANPNEFRRSTLQRFAWQFDGNALIRLSWPVTDPTGAVVPTPEVLELDVSDFRLAYRDSSGGWHEQWPPRGGTSTALPAAIEISLDTQRFGLIRRLLVVDP